MVLGDREQVLYGKGYITDQSVAVPSVFLQNPFISESGTDREAL